MKALTLDVKPGFKPTKRVEREYEKQLRQVAKQVGHLISLYQQGSTLLPGLDKALDIYAESLTPWARNVSERMLESVGRTNLRQWKAQSVALGRALRTDTNVTLAAALQAEQVDLIKSLPLEAGQRAQQLAMEAATGGKRADVVAAEIAKSGQVTESRAMLIARTEIAKANSSITQARSAAVGAKRYIWRTSEDAAVRESHEEMEGRVIEWDNPPTLSDGMTGHAGQFPNCRCYPEPIIED